MTEKMLMDGGTMPKIYPQQTLYSGIMFRTMSSGVEMHTSVVGESILVGLLVDVSGSTTSAIQNRGVSQNRLQSFQEALEKFIREYADVIERKSVESTLRVHLFAYGFGFGNPLAQFLGRSGPVVRDLLSLPGASSSTIDVVSLAKEWPRYKNHVEGLAVEMFGATPMGQAFRIVQDRFAAELAQSRSSRILFVLSDGEPTDLRAEEIMKTADELKRSGVLIISCYVTDEDVAEPRHIYGRTPSGWSDGAKLMFNCSSLLPRDSAFDSYFREFG
jgi:hypothetical protein